jgi:hypothetical protein
MVSVSVSRNRWTLQLLAPLCLLSVAIVTVLNYYGFATSTIKGSSSMPIEMPAPELQTLNQALLEEIHELLRGIQPIDTANNNDSLGEHSATPPAATLRDQDIPEFPADHDGSNMHIVFSMSCDQRNRLLQQTVVQLTASWVGQKGPITQILSGCSDEERLRVMEEPTLYYDFRRHFTPSFAVNPEPGVEDNYMAYNKPFGLRHFLLNAAPDVKHDIIALVDGDFFFFRPLEANMGRNMSKYYHGRRDPLTVNDTVVDGVALAQDWNALQGGFFAEDKTDVLNKVCGGLPCGNVSREDGAEYYGSIGPPYIMTRRDALRMVDDYCHLCVTTRQVSNEWIAEMFAYSVAAANNGIKHTALSHLGISSPNFEGGGHEYWSFVDGTMTNPCEDNLRPVIPKDPPVTVHACQWIGNFYKGVWPATLANCDSPMLKIPPSTDWSEIETTVEPKSQRIQREEVWAKCTLTKIMNRALVELKQRTCPSGFNTFRAIDAVRIG